MRQIDGRWVCVECGAVLDIASDENPKATIHAASGKPNVRVLVVDGKEVHRCEVRQDRDPNLR